MNENELMHFGVLGMKWGKRKQPERSGNGRQKKMSRKELKKQRKAILRDYRDTKSVKEAIYNRDFNRGKTRASEDHWMDEAYKSMVKKYGRKKFKDALKWEKRRGEVATVMGAAAGISLAVLFNQFK